MDKNTTIKGFVGDSTPSLGRSPTKGAEVQEKDGRGWRRADTIEINRTSD
jgi:hypothetical protein